MASYFDLPPQPTAPAAALQAPRDQGDQCKGSSLLSPQISRILDGFDFDDGSSSSDGDQDEDEQDDKPRHTTPSHKTTTKSQSNTRRSRLGSVELVPEDFPPSPPAVAESGPQPTTASAARGGGSGSGSSVGKKDKASKPRHANMERFKSLRSVLFLTKIEDNMSKMRSEEQTRNDAALDWKAQHDKRQGLNRPATPDKEKEKATEDATPKDGLTTRVATKIRRMASHSAPTMEKIPESPAPATTHDLTRRDSTATDTDDDAPTHPRDAPSDDDLTRWISHADPPSGSDMSAAASPTLVPADIPQLVQHASQLSMPTLPAVQFHNSGEDDASTASDSDAVDDAEASEDEDADELVRWVSRRDGALAGPVRRGTPSPTLVSHPHAHTRADSSVDLDEDVPELGAWATKARARTSQDSGVAERGRTAERSGSRGREKNEVRGKTGARTGLCDEDVDELVRWVSRRDSKAGGDEEVRGRGAVVV